MVTDMMIEKFADEVRRQVIDLEERGIEPMFIQVAPGGEPKGFDFEKNEDGLPVFDGLFVVPVIFDDQKVPDIVVGGRCFYGHGGVPLVFNNDKADNGWIKTFFKDAL
jgi:hypothetical protein